MNKQDSTQSQSYPVASRANHSVLPGSVEARLMTVTSGRKCLESYNSSSPLGLLVKMCLESSLWHSTRCFLIWKRRDMKPNVSLFRLAVSGPHTDGSAVQLSDGEKTEILQNSKTLLAMERAGLISQSEQTALLQGYAMERCPRLMDWLIQYELSFRGLIPTTRASDYKGAALYRFWTPTSWGRAQKKYRSQLHEHLELTPLGRIGYMNPEWIEWFMGFPIGWTELNA